MTFEHPSLLLGAGILRQTASDQTCAPVHGVNDGFRWIFCQAEAHSSALLVLIGVGSLVVAALTYRRGENRTYERTDAADAQIANLAYPVRRTLEKMLDDCWRLNDPPAYRRKRARHHQRGFVEHEGRVEDILTEATGASADVTASARRAAQLFWSAASGVNEMAAVDLSTHDAEVPEEADQAYQEAKVTTGKCVEVLRRLDAPVREA